MKINNFEAVFRSANEQEMAMGFNWYLDSHNYLKAMSEATGYSLQVTCAVVAVLSPRNNWSANCFQAQEVLKARGNRRRVKIKFSTFSKNVDKAFKIAKTKDISYLHGPKVEQFYLNLLNPFDSDSCTVDSFIIACWYDISPNSEEIGKYAGEKNIERLKNEIKILARKHQMLPCQVQAIIWIVFHRMVRSMVSYSGQMKLNIF